MKKEVAGVHFKIYLTFQARSSHNSAVVRSSSTSTLTDVHQIAGDPKRQVERGDQAGYIPLQVIKANKV